VKRRSGNWDEGRDKDGKLQADEVDSFKLHVGRVYPPRNNR